jgi:amidase
VGLKPSRGRISSGPDLGDSFLVADGMLTHTTRETAELLDVLAGYEVGDASWAPAPAAPFATAVERPAEGLRIGVTTRSPLEGSEIDPLAERATREAAELLESLGHHVEEVEPPWSQPGLLELFSAAFGPAVAMGIVFGSMIAGREPAEDDLEPLSRMIWERSQGLSSGHYLAATAQLQGFGRALIAFSQPYDAILTPALGQRPVPIGSMTGALPEPDDTFRRSGHFTPFTAIANVTGQPAISVPLFHGEDGLPLAVQLVGRPVEEHVLLGLCAQLEAARPWADRRPPGV